MRELYRYTLSFHICAPFHFPSEELGQFGYDSIGHQDADGNPIIPREQIRGVLRHGLKALCQVGNEQAAQLLQAFGSEGPNVAPTPRSELKASVASDDYSSRTKGLVSIDDAVGKRATSSKVPAAPRVALDQDTGAAAPGQLQFIEQLALPEERVSFTAPVYLYQEPESDFSETLCIALEFHDAIGAQKSVGYGALSDVKCVKSAPKPAFSGVASADTVTRDRLIWSFNVDRPYLVASENLSENAYRGARDIPGGALKGLLAHHLAVKAGTMEVAISDALSQLTISFASPVGTDSSLPLCIVLDETADKRVDLSLADLNLSELGALKHQRDWKNTQSEFEMFENRVHVAIDGATGGVVEHQLYTTHARLAPKSGFQAILDFNDIDQDARQQIIKAIAEPLAGLGRTDAIVETTGLTGSLNDSEETAISGRTVLKLLSPALLIDWGENGAAQAAYEKYWRDALPNSTLLDIFTKERLVGGYQAMRFGVTGKYTPFILTQASSVFVVDVAEADAPKLKSLLRSGLCLSNWAALQTSWQNCPFVPQNGYGALAVHTPDSTGSSL